MIDAGGMAILAQNAQSAQIQGLINALERERQPDVAGQSFAQSPDLAQYARLGQNIMRLSGIPEPGTSSDPVFGGADLTGGFDHGWLTERLAAGSADGASIQSGGGSLGGGGRKSKPGTSETGFKPFKIRSGDAFGDTAGFSLSGGPSGSY